MSPRLCIALTLLLFSIFSTHQVVQCDSEEDDLLQGINSYRTSLNLTALTKNSNAECLAQGVAEQFKNQPCTNSTGANTVPGTEPQFPNYPTILADCHLNVTNTRDGQVMPACVPDLVPSLVLSNYTESQYAENLNDTKYTGIGLGSKNDWIVVVLTTNTTEGGFAPATDSMNAANMIFKVGRTDRLLILLVASLLLL